MGTVSSLIPKDTQRIAECVMMEKALLGSAILDEDKLPLILSSLDEEHFYDPQNQRIFRAIIVQSNSGEPVDFLSIWEGLDRPPFSMIEGLYDAALPGHTEYFIKKLKDAAARRRAQAILQDSMNTLGHYDSDLVANFQNMNSDMVGLISRDNHMRPIGSEGMVETMKWIEGRSVDKIVRTGIHGLDNLIGGYFPGKMIVVAGRTSMGKTAFAQTLLLNLGLAKHVAGYVSVEGDNDDLKLRLLSIRSGVPLKDLINGDLDMIEADLVTKASGEIGALNIFAQDKQRNWGKIKAQIRIMKFRNPQLKVVFLDHMSVVEENRYRQRWENMSAVSAEFHGLCVELGITGVLLCQINRQTENRKDHRPTMADLRECGSVEQDADVILLLYRPAYYSKKENPEEALLSVAKQKNGPTGAVALRFEERCIRFSDA